MTVTEHWIKALEERDYDSLKSPKHLIHLIKHRDRLAYYSLQLQPFFYQAPWDLPVEVDGRRYAPATLCTLQGWGMSSVDFYDLLTDIEVKLIEAAARRGITLRKRGNVDEEGDMGAPTQRQRGDNGFALD